MSNVAMGLGQQLLRRKPIIFQHKHHTGEELTRNLGTFQLMMFGVGATVGTGIFFVLSEAIPVAGPAVIISFIVAAVCAGLSALCYAELASAIPVSGSTYSFTYHALGEGLAVLVGGCVLLEYGVATSAVAVGWSGYFNELLYNLFGFQLPTALSTSFVPGTDGEPTGGIINLPAVVLVMLCMLLLLRGASESATINAVMVCIKLGVLALFVVLAFTAFNADHYENFFQFGAAGISGAAGTIFFSFIGLDAVATASEEVKNPQKAIPRAIIGALIIVATVYILVALAGLAAEPAEWFGTPEAGEAGLAKILENVTGTAVWATILAAGAVISVFSVTLVTLYGQTRILFSIARDGLIPHKFLTVNQKTMTPVFNTIVVSIIVAVIAGFVPSDYLWDSVSFGTLVAFSLVAISIIVLRRTRPDLERPFKVPLYPVVPILTVVTCIYVLASLKPITWAICASWLAIVAAYYLIYARKRATLSHYESDEEISEPIHDLDEA